MTADQLRTRFPHASAAFLRQNADDGACSKTVAAPSKPRLRQNAAGLNKTEQAFADWFRASQPEGGSPLHAQAVTLKIGNGVRYTPDFVDVIPHSSGSVSVHAFEVKGFMRDDACIKLKIVATTYPWIAFHLVTRAKGGGWDIQDILP